MYEYLSPESVKLSTQEAIARLELTKHQVRIAIAAGGGDENILVASEETGAEAIERLNKTIAVIKEAFAAELAHGEEEE